MNALCEQCGALPARLICLGQDVCRICCESMLGAFDEDGYGGVTKEQLAGLLRICTTMEGAQLMALVSGHPPVFTREKPMNR